MKATITLAVILFTHVFSYAQGVGVNDDNTNPDASAMLDVKSTTKGMLVPRVALTGTTDIVTIASPATSLLVYNTTTISDVTPGFYYFEGGAWKPISVAGGGNLDAAYDFGGAGAGRIITADAGVTEINGTDGFLTTGTYGVGLAIGSANGIPQGAGTRMFFNPSKAAFRAGFATTEWDYANVGDYSTAMGYNSTASGTGATAMGAETTASGIACTAMGAQTTASGNYSTAMGRSTTALSYGETSIGLYNTLAAGADPVNWVTTDRLFTIGNGKTGMNRSDALIVFKSGNATLAGTLTQSSDKRLKTNISELSGALSNILQLNGYSYNWINTKQRGTEKQIGVMAQEIQALYPALVREAVDGYLSVNYSGLVPVLIEATKEQQVQIEELKQENTNLKAQLSEVAQLKAEVAEIKALLKSSALK